MTNSNARLIKVNLNVGNVSLACLIAMRDSIEYDNVVNLGNAYAKVRDRVTPVEWRNALAKLAREGKYAAMVGEFNGQYGTLVR